MKTKVICLVLAAVLTVSLFPVTAFAEFADVNEEIYYEMNQTFTPLDIKDVANMDFADEVVGDGVGGWTDQGSVNDMRNFDLRGRVKLLGVDFDIIDPEKNNGKAVITLRGQNLETVPNEVEIPVNQKGAGVYFLHSAAYVVTNVATYSFVYEDGSRYDVPIRNKQEIFNFWGTGSSDRCKPAWNGTNLSTSSVSIYMYAMENPYPDKVISKIVCATKGDDAFCMIVAATLTDKGPYMMTESDRGNPDTSNWYAYEAPTFDTIVGTVLDCSFLLDGPAGKHGWLQNKDGELFFEDGTMANFWGTDVGENALTGHERTDKLVNRIAALGFNLVRIHNYMAPHVGARNVYGNGVPQKQLDPQRVDSLCYFISKLKEKGIYVYLDMNTSRGKSEDDNIRGGSDKSITQIGLKPIYYFDDELMKLDENYIREILGTYNPYTGYNIGQDPAIAFIDFKNETTFFSCSRDYAKYYDADVRRLYCEWLKERYGTDENLKKAWRYLDKEGLEDGESLDDNSVQFGYLGEREKFVKPRQADNLHFIADVMSKYYASRKAIVEEMGYKGLSTTCTVWGTNYPALMYTLADSDLTDSHVYWSHPSAYYSMQEGTTMGGNGPISMMEDKNFGFYGYLFNESVYGMAHTITEWDECDLNPTMAEEYTLMGAFSSLQDWVPLNFGFFSQMDEVTEVKTTENGRHTLFNDYYHEDQNSLRNYWSINNNPIKMGCLPAGSIMKLRGDVKKAERGFYTRYSQNDYFDASNQILSHEPFIGMVGRSGLAYDKRSYDESYNDNDILYKAYMSKKLGLPYVSDTGEMRTDLANATFELNTARSQAVVGRITGKEFETDDMKVTVENPFANINLTSLTNEPIWNSGRLLITAAGDQRNTDEVRSRDGTSVIRGGTAPILVEPIVGRLTLKTKDDVTVYRINSTGERIGTARIEKDENGYSVVCLSADDTCMNYEVVRETKDGTKRSANEHIVYEQLEVKPLFNDLAGFEWAQDKITRIALMGDMSGVSDELFAPGATVTRGDYVSAVMSACKLKASAKDGFADVAQSNKNYNSVTAAKAFGIVCGDENGNFNPDAAISCADALAILERAVKSGNVNADAQKCFEKVLGNSYDESKTLTRAQTACIIYGVLWE